MSWKGYPEFDRCDGDEARVGLFGFVVAGGNPAPVLEFVEQPLDKIAPFVFGPVVRDGVKTIALCRDHRFDACGGDFLADSIGIIAAICEERLDAVGHHAEQRCKALHIARSAGCQHEAEREASGIAPRVEPGRKAAARPARPLCLLSPLFMPPAQ